MMIDEKIEVIKEGINSGNCGHAEWIMDFHHGMPENIFEYNRICKDCGRIERVTEYHKSLTYEETFEKFYGEAK